MTSLRKIAAAAAVAVATLMPAAGPATATVFAAWEVAGVAWGDTLNVRKYPASHSQKQSAYPNGTVLQMTGRCTGGVDLHAIQRQPAWKQRQLVRYQWCQAWLDPTGSGEYRNGWVYGRYIRPA